MREQKERVEREESGRAGPGGVRGGGGKGRGRGEGTRLESPLSTRGRARGGGGGSKKKSSKLARARRGRPQLKLFPGRERLPKSRTLYDFSTFLHTAGNSCLSCNRESIIIVTYYAFVHVRKDCFFFVVIFFNSKWQLCRPPLSERISFSLPFPATATVLSLRRLAAVACGLCWGCGLWAVGWWLVAAGVVAGRCGCLLPFASNDCCTLLKADRKRKLRKKGPSDEPGILPSPRSKGSRAATAMRRAGRGSSSEAEEGDDPDHRGGGDATSGSPKGSPGRTPLKTVLQNFLNHVDTLEARKNEGEDTYEKEFQQLKAMGDSFRLKPEFSCKQGEMEVNRKKNRYKDILPFDSTRVTLSEYPGVPGSDYINANHVKGASGSNAYIAAQGPLPHTVNDFWRMVVECEVQVIVMACNETEAGKHKCERYWSQPEDTEEGQQQDSKEKGEDEERQFGKFFVKTLKMREICPDFLVRTMRLRWTPEGGTSAPEEERTVCQFHYTAWPDHGIPTQVKPLLEMVRLIRDCQASETLPVLVHCSAGCGRTGTICAIDFIWGLLRTGKLTADFSLFELVKDMRRQRIAMVQTVEQYILVHRAVKELFLEQLRVIDSHPYENVDDDGNPLFRHPDEITPDYETIFVKDSEQGKLLCLKCFSYFCM